MSDIHLPPGLAQQQNQRAMNTMIVFQAAIQIMPQMLSLEYQHAVARAAKEADPMGINPDARMNVEIDIARAADISFHGAMALLERCGVIEPQKKGRR